MKKLLIVALGMGVSSISFGQKANVQSAINYLNDKDYDHALEYINNALKDPGTANEAKTWAVKGNIYLAMTQDPKYKASNPYREAATAYMKVVEIKPDYSEKKAISVNLTNFAFNYYNDGVHAFNDRTPEKYAEAAELMKRVVDIHDLEVQKKYDIVKYFDTVAGEAKYVIANCQYYLNKNTEAIAALTEVKNAHLVNSADIYVHLSDIYEKENKQDEKLAIIKEGRAAFPKDESLKAMEINYYIKAGKLDVLTGKLEESAKEHPDNPEIWFNLGTIYMNSANPKGGTPPANAAELSLKAEDAYQKALKLDGDNIDYNYNVGAMYFNQGVDVNEKMNAITGASAAETKKYEELKKMRNGHFAKAEPYMEKVVTVLEAKGDKMRKEDRVTYFATLQSLQKIYSAEGKTDKATEMTNKMK